MNWSRGFFRLWALVAVVWVPAVVIANWSDIRGRFALEGFDRVLAELKLRLPVDCAKARGQSGVDYEPEKKGPWLDYGGKHLCWYEEEKFREIYPEHKNVSREDLRHKLHADTGRPLSPPADAWRHVGVAAFHALFWPALLLVAGLAVRWVLIGFRA